jgi:hypothetical protein
MKKANKLKQTEADQVYCRVVRFLRHELLEQRRDSWNESGAPSSVEIPPSLFGELNRDQIVRVCNSISKSAKHPFLLAHEWRDLGRTEGHVVFGFHIDQSLKAPVASLQDSYVTAYFPTYGFCVGRVAHTNPSASNDLSWHEEPEVSINIVFYVDQNGRLVEPAEPISTGCSRHTLSRSLGKLTSKQLVEIKKLLFQEQSFYNRGDNRIRRCQ